MHRSPCVPTALQSFVGGDLMSHPSWTISWDVLSTSISPLRSLISSLRSLAPSQQSTGIVADEQKEAKIRGTTDDDDARSSCICLFLADDTQRTRATVSCTHTTSCRDRPFLSLSFSPFSHLLLSFVFSLSLSCLRALLRR